MAFSLGTSSSDAISLNPKYDYKESNEKIEDNIRVIENYYAYKWGDYKRFEFKVDYIVGSDAAIVNSWWESNTELLFFVTSEEITDTYSVMLRGDLMPLGSYNKTFDEYYSGNIELEGY